MAEQFSNNALTVLTADLPEGITTVMVQNAAGFPSLPQFRILIDVELMLVTAVDGNEFTVERGIEGTPDVAHITGTGVAQTLTAGALYAIAEGTGAIVFGPPLTTGNIGYLVDGAPLTNGDTSDPQIIFDAMAQVVMVGNRVSSELVFDAEGQVILTPL